MKRRTFIGAAIAAAPLVSGVYPPTGTDQDEGGFKVPAGEGRRHGHIQLKGVNVNILDVKISGKDTAGALAIFEQTSLSPGKGTPLHIHPFQDEIFYVLEGEYYFQVGEQKHSLRKGDSIFLPRQVPHSWIQVSERGKMTVTLQPAGKLEEFFVAMAARQTAPTPEETARMFEAHEMKLVGPPVKRNG
jgi:quercetin dioxygenase-like cupin family protein